jgi:hypothetical protein
LLSCRPFPAALLASMVTLSITLALLAVIPLVALDALPRRDGCRHAPVPVAFFKLKAPAGGKEDMGVDAGEAAESAST